MKWTRGHRSGDVLDLRGRSGGGAFGRRLGGLPIPLSIGGGGIGLVILLLYVALTMCNQGGGGGGYPSYAPPAESKAEQDEQVQFVHFVIDDIQDAFAAKFEIRDLEYRRAKLVLFTDAVSTACGNSSSAVGPFYCPSDERAYIDLTFFHALRDQLGAGGDFAQAYVLAHEIGHHVQHILGVESRDSVAIELQADCFAGVWAYTTSERGLLESGDIDEAVNAAASIGDDRLQKMSGREVNPETFTHGTSEQRASWFKRGLRSGHLEDCDTFR
jgi:predicted metalloprotease